MEDRGIIELYFNRDQRAVEETRAKYGGLCHSLALNLLGVAEDAEECVNDCYLAAWNRIPPERPRSLRAYLARLTRNLAVSRYRRNRASKRYTGMEAQLEELAECLPSREDVEVELERRELGALISRWLDGLSERDRRLFIRRHFYGAAVEELARELSEKPNTVSQRLRRLRLELRDVLEREGVPIES